MLPDREGDTLALPPGESTRDGQAGFTVIEVLVAMLILLIGVLGTFVLIDGSLASTSRTTAREQGTNVARDLVERSRQVSYEAVTVALAAQNLSQTLPASEVSNLSGDTFEVKRRGVVYTVTISACAVDDPTDGAGQGDAEFCVAQDGTIPPGPPPALPAGSVRVLGVDVTLGGSLLDTVCDAVGHDTEIANALAAAVSPVAAVGVCAAATQTGGVVQVDSDPDDLRRVRIDVTWNRGGAGSVSQTTLLPNPAES